MRRLILLMACVASSCATAIAQDAQGNRDEDQSRDGRFVFSEVDEGVLRLDTRTGDVSLCVRQTPGWICRLVPDERGAVDAELTRLQTQNAELKNALAARGAPEAKPDQANPAPPNKSGGASISLPTTDDLKYAASVAALVWHRLVEMIANLKSDLRQKT